MPTNKTLSPEEIELSIKVEQLSEIENSLTQLELEFNSLQAEILSFQKRYTDLVVQRMYKLDVIESKIAEYLVSTDPNNPEYHQNLNQLKEQIEEAEKTFERENNKSSSCNFKASESIKKLYREIAKKIHPDLTLDNKERERRTKLMTELNEAYQNSDEKKLGQILTEWQHDPENVSGEDIGSQLIKIIRKIAQVQKRVSLIDEETNILKNAEIFKLLEKSRESSINGVDLLIQMSGYLDALITERSQYLEFLIMGEK